jgi:hypothetical protein
MHLKPNRNHKSTMSTKATPTTRKPTAPAKKNQPAAKPAKKKPAANAAKIPPAKPILIGGLTGDAFTTMKLGAMLGGYSSATLKELLRARALKIPKDKDTMVDRLVTYLVRQGGNFTLSLH